MYKQQFTLNLGGYDSPKFKCLEINIEQGFDISGSASFDEEDNELGDY